MVANNHLTKLLFSDRILLGKRFLNIEIHYIENKIIKIQMLKELNYWIFLKLQ